VVNLGIYDEVKSFPKPTRKPKEPKQLTQKTPLKAKTPLTARTNLKPKNPFGQKNKPKRKKKSDRLDKRGVKIPSRKVRGTYGAEEYQKALEIHGQNCKEGGCLRRGEEMHHPKFKSGGGRGKWRNAMPLCKEHHMKCHTVREYADKWRAYCETLFGKHYFKDEYDLWLEQLISEPTKEQYEEFMLREEKKCRENLGYME